MTSLMDLIRDLGIPYRFTLHDYSIGCHRNDLIRSDTRRYCGLAPVETCRICIARDPGYPEAIDPALRRETYAEFLRGAELVLAPSQDIASRLKEHGADYDITVQAHDDERFAPVVQAHAPKSRLVNFVTFGAVGFHKGSHVILALARDAARRNLPIRYHIVGYTDVDSEMAREGVTVTGAYDHDGEAMEKARALAADRIFLPSIWPETYSYTLSMAFAMQCRPVVFDIGAQAERIRRVGFGDILPYDLMFDTKALNESLIELVMTERLASQ
ncbi:MAG TPA: hypothetical protein VF511_00360, partial [Chthoniobacterales bacterium]